MTRVALDSNILVYAELEPETPKGRRAAEVILSAARDGVIPVQVLGEFLRVIQRRVPSAFAEAVKQAAIYQGAFLMPATTEDVLNIAAKYASVHQLQLWDGVVCAAAAKAGATVLLTEDLQDGRNLEGLRLINPFATANDAEIEVVLGR